MGINNKTSFGGGEQVGRAHFELDTTRDDGAAALHSGRRVGCANHALVTTGAPQRVVAPAVWTQPLRDKRLEVLLGEGLFEFGRRQVHG